jgi:hypothetical protein
VLSSRRWPRVSPWARPWRDSWCRSRRRCYGGSRSRRWTRLHAVSTATVQVTPIRSTPDDHFTASPYCGVVSTTNRCIGRAGRCPTVSAERISAPGVQYADRVIVPSPNDHFIAGPDRSVRWLGNCADNPPLSFPVVPETSPLRAKGWDPFVPLANCDGASKRPQ